MLYSLLCQGINLADSYNELITQRLPRLQLDDRAFLVAEAKRGVHP